jgi:hypothetical protein
MRFQAIVCALGLSLALAGAGSALAQSRGPPMMTVGGGAHIVAVAGVSELGSRAQALASKLNGKTDAASVSALKEVHALQAKLGKSPSEHDLENIETAISRIEQSTH